MGFWSKLFAPFKRITMVITGNSARSKPVMRSIAEQEICRAIIDCNASHTAQADVLHVVMDGKGRISEIKRSSGYTKLFEHPNRLMSGYDFMYALSWQLDMKNTALAWIEWNGLGKPAAIWPIDYQQFEFREVQGGGWAVLFSDPDGNRHTLPMEDMVVLRRHYDGSGVAGLGNAAISETIELVSTVDDSLKSAVSVSNKIHGILHTKKSMLNLADVEHSQSEFKAKVDNADDYGGILTLDSFEDYTPIATNAWSANASQMKQITSRLYAYWRTPEDVVNNTANSQTMQNYYESIINARWRQMSQAFTAALFSRREMDVGNRILITGGAALGVSFTEKLTLIGQTKDFGLMTTNEYRELLGYAPVEDGDDRLVSLNYVKSTDQSVYQVGANTTEEDENNAV